MNAFIKTLASCAFLGAAGGTIAAPVYFPDGQFNSGKGSWGEVGPLTSFSYPENGGSDGSGGVGNGYGVMNATNGQWGIWVNSNDNGTFLPLAPGLVAGNGYSFKMDMRIEDGSPNSNIGGLKLEWQGAGDTGNIYLPYLGAGWQTYSFNRIIPAGATGLKVVPLWGPNSIVGFDNIGYESVPYFVAPPPPTDLVHENTFDVEGSNWGGPAGGGGGVTSSRTWSGSEGNPSGSTVLTVANPAGAPAAVSFTYTAPGINFGDGPVKISFDGKLLAAFPGTALHVRYNGNFIGAIHGSFNDTGYTTFTREFDLGQGFATTETFTLQFEFAMGAVVGSGGSIAIDNIRVTTNLPQPPPPVMATILSGTQVGWTPLSSEASYQPQESANNVAWTNLGPLVTTGEVSTRFDESTSAFYRVQATTPDVFDNAVPNPGFEINDFPIEPLGTNSWVVPVAENPGARMEVVSSYGAIGPHSGAKMLLIESTGPGAPAPNTEVRSELFAVTAEANYTLSFWVSNPIKVGGANPQYSIFYYDDFNGLIGEGIFTTGFGSIGAEWTKFTVPNVVPPVGAAFMTVGWIQAGSAEANLHWVTLIDDVLLTEGTLITPSGTSTIAATATPSVQISWPTVTGRTYQVESSLHLDDWVNFGASITGDDTIWTAVDAITPNAKFYRVGETETP